MWLCVLEFATAFGDRSVGFSPHKLLLIADNACDLRAEVHAATRAAPGVGPRFLNCREACVTVQKLMGISLLDAECHLAGWGSYFVGQ